MQLYAISKYSIFVPASVVFGSRCAQYADGNDEPYSDTFIRHFEVTPVTFGMTALIVSFEKDKFPDAGTSTLFWATGIFATIVIAMLTVPDDAHPSIMLHVSTIVLPMTWTTS